MTTRAFGPHLTIDISGCNQEKLKDFQLVFDLLNELPQRIGMEKITLPYVVRWKDKRTSIPGISGFVMIAESHISIHTFPEERYAFIDVFSCKWFDTKFAADCFTSAFEANASEIRVVERGLSFPRNVGAGRMDGKAHDEMPHKKHRPQEAMNE